MTDKAGDEELQVRIEFQHRVGDLDMKVYGPKETKKANSSNDNEEVKLTGPTGSYRIEVYGYENAVNEYDLHIVRGQLSPPSPPPSYGLPEVVWQQCRYRHNGQWLLDMTGDYWSRLSVSEQQRYATQYQRGYAAKLGKPVAQSFSGGGTTVVMRLIPPGRFWMGFPARDALLEFIERFSLAGPVFCTVFFRLLRRSLLSRIFFLCNSSVALISPFTSEQRELN